MTPLEYAKPDRVWLSTSSDYDEAWVQKRIAADPNLLGLGNLVLRDRERMQPNAGRLDLLFSDDEQRRYEVEIQLGRTDEAHIIRTLEYWDIERKRYPQYEHTAVIVAEDITSRFLNVISLFNGFIPLVALQMHALRLNNNISLVFTKVLDQVRLGLVEEDEEVTVDVDRAYWEDRSGKDTLSAIGEIEDELRRLDSEIGLKYNKHYIAIAKQGRANNFVSFVPRKNWFYLGLRLDKSDELEQRLRDAGLGDDLSYESRRYWVVLTKDLWQAKRDALRPLFKEAFANARS